ncbi:hypothetical protein Moror_17855 [Moniliophthora roreri MCA 2997]|uniref:Uncharacterized protein n=2 Tax=Moniliophthora roreri TaxID=221103 RepID=V2XXM3_MONRO|nr:hypothetical protein Moror_17855 [Moniliophthora roreri MCA 2997]
MQKMISTRGYSYSNCATQKAALRDVKYDISVNYGLKGVVDLSGLDIDFDYTCFEGLDDDLIFYPAVSFAAVCCADAIYDPPEKEMPPSPNVARETIPEVAEVAEYESSDDDYSSSTSRGSDVYTFEYQDDREAPESDIDFRGVSSEPLNEKKMSAVELHHFYDVQDDGRSFISFRERCYKVSGYVETVGPFNPLKESAPRKSIGDRIVTTFHSTLPSRRAKMGGDWP